MSTGRGAAVVGRDRELASLRDLLATGSWVTLAGPGGMGKTTLAVRLADDARREGRDVRFVELGSATDIAVGLGRIAHALEVPPTRDDVGHLDHTITARLERLAPLLVIDEVELLADGLAPHVARWASTGAKVLLTSRRVLGGTGERVVALEPLEIDEALALFAARARAARPDVRLDDALSRALVETIDRIPLAIELAASRLRVLSLAELVRRVEAPLVVLRSGAGGRHASMRRAVTDSLALLTPCERRLFALASTLRDGFTVDDAEAALAREIGPEELLDGLDTLVRTSLLRVRIEDDQIARYSYFATVREVAGELEDPARGDVRLRASRHFARSRGPVSEAELDNLVEAHRTAVQAARSPRSPAHAEDARALLERIEGGLSRSGRSALREMLAGGTLAALEAVGAPADARASVRIGRALARTELGKTAAAREDLLAALALDPLDDRTRALASIRLAALDDVASDTVAARARLEEALGLLARTPDDVSRHVAEAEAKLHLGHALRREGRLADAREVLRESVARHRELADDVSLAATLYELAVVQIFDRSPAADAVIDEGLAVARRAHARRVEGTLQMARGCVLHERGELAAARACHADAASLFADLGDRHREASALFYLATTYVESGGIDDALGLLARARELAAEVGTPRYVALVEACAASTLALAGRFAEARAAMTLARRHAARVAEEPALRATVAVHGRVVDFLTGVGSSAALAASEREVAESSNDDSRFALRLLQRIARGDRAEPLASLVVAIDGAWFRPPGAAASETLPARSPLRRLLVCLVAQRLASPGRAVTVDELLHAGWPDEKMRAQSALNRLYVAIATLRKRGLTNVVERAGGGYLVTPAIAVEWRDAGTD